MSIVEFVKLFLSMLAMGSIAVTGWYFITRGEEVTLPDGTVKKEGMIFKGFYFFWMKKKPAPKKVYYRGEELGKILSEIHANFPNIKFKVHDSSFEIDGPADTNMYVIAVKWKANAFYKGSGLWVIYKEYPDYVFPEVVRMPMVKCVTCMASIYGSIFYWTFVSLVREPLFTWSGNSIVAAIAFWIAFCFSLSVINTALVRKFH